MVFAGKLVSILIPRFFLQFEWLASRNHITVESRYQPAKFEAMDKMHDCIDCAIE